MAVVLPRERGAVDLYDLDAWVKPHNVTVPFVDEKTFCEVIRATKRGTARDATGIHSDWFKDTTPMPKLTQINDDFESVDDGKLRKSSERVRSHGRSRKTTIGSPWRNTCTPSHLEGRPLSSQRRTARPRACPGRTASAPGTWPVVCR